MLFFSVSCFILFGPSWFIQLYFVFLSAFLLRTYIFHLRRDLPRNIFLEYHEKHLHSYVAKLVLIKKNLFISLISSVYSKEILIMK